MPIPDDVLLLVERHPLPWSSVAEDPGNPHRVTVRDACGAVIAWVTQNPDISPRQRLLNAVTIMEDMLRRWED
jgi:hypothetical protein